MPSLVTITSKPMKRFLTAILHRGLRNDFSFFQVASTFFHILFGLLYPSSIWTFISLFYLDFYFPLLFGLFFSFSFLFQFFFSVFSILLRSLILDSSKFYFLSKYLILELNSQHSLICSIFVRVKIKMQSHFY